MTEIVTGTDFLRATLRNRAFKGSLALIARDIGVGAAALDGFMRGEAKLAPAALCALAKHLHDADYDAERDLLRRANKPEVKLLCPSNYPPTLAETGWKPPKFTAGPQMPGPQPHKPAPAKPKPKRAGWVE